MTPFQALMALQRDLIAIRGRMDEQAAGMRRHASRETDRIAEKLEDASISVAHALADLNAARAAEKARRRG